MGNTQDRYKTYKTDTILQHPSRVVTRESDLNLLEIRNLVGSGFNDLESGVPAEVVW